MSAYRAVGFQGNAESKMKPNALNMIESFRAAPKFEEQMLLGYLHSAKGSLAPRPHWKIKRFEMERPRVSIPLPDLST